MKICSLVVVAGIIGVTIVTQIQSQGQPVEITTPGVPPAASVLQTQSTSKAKIVPIAMQQEAPVANGAITITVPTGARQRFEGLGTSIGNWGGNYQKLPASERAKLSRMMWHDLKFNTLRMWFNTDQYAPTPGAHDMTEFRRQYVDSGVIADARKNGVTTLLLGPEHLPEYMKDKNEKGEQVLKASEVENYAVLLAEFIERLKTETGITLTATGVQNEPNVNEHFSAEQMVAIVKKLRSELDVRGMASVKIIASEHASPDFLYFEQMKAFKADPQAWNALAGVSSHSYNMAATDESAAPIVGADGKNIKPYWMTESSENGAEEPGDMKRAMMQSARFLNDMNHHVTHWIHFLGFEVADPKDDATRIISFTTDPVSVKVFQKYYTYQQLSNTFDVGAVFRDSQSSLEGDMTWTFGTKPRVIAATAQNPDGSWGIGVANYTADSFLGVQGWGDDDWNTKQGGHTPAQSFPVTIRVEELKNKGAMPFTVYRTNAKLQNVKSETVMMKNGEVTVTAPSLELVTLRSNTTPKAVAAKKPVAKTAVRKTTPSAKKPAKVKA